jgi:8-oxo-dGTP pyrophosphatase MutT (NUDIX family)
VHPRTNVHARVGRRGAAQPTYAAAVPLLIDVPSWPAHGRLWSHLISDTSFGELHAFAELVGLPPRSFEGDHYDVPAERYDAVVAAGARQVSIRELVIALHASGLRRPKRKGERVLASTLLPSPDDGPSHGARVDLVASRLPPPVAPARVEILVFQRPTDTARPSLLVTNGRTGAALWSLPGAAVAPGDALGESAAHAVSQQAGVRVTPSGLRLCGHLRTLGAAQGWTTYLTTTLDEPAEPVVDARWLPTNGHEPSFGPTPWWPLVDWLLDRRQPLTQS